MSDPGVAFPAAWLIGFSVCLDNSRFLERKLRSEQASELVIAPAPLQNMCTILLALMAQISMGNLICWWEEEVRTRTTESAPNTHRAAEECCEKTSGWSPAEVTIRLSNFRINSGTRAVDKRFNFLLHFLAGCRMSAASCTRQDHYVLVFWLFLRYGWANFYQTSAAQILNSRACFAPSYFMLE